MYKGNGGGKSEQQAILALDICTLRRNNLIKSSRGSVIFKQDI